ncbi:VanZ family protein [Streptomyces sp. P38-E01]|uniref:VanZ family protein n=1 Tax=Streptomyces tardus TaxID=2780544 RepID=A0A949N490_9ACTN|nr:VanZ family protein [Streptomyces tardus]MBU7596707.1 VanZ family protein [Streptomyces tardus]
MHHQRPSSTRAFRLRAAGFLLLAGHLVLVAWLTLRPLSVPWVPAANIQPFATIATDLREGPVHALRTMGGDLALLAPLGALLPLASGSLGSRTGSFFRAVVATGGLALALEAVRSSVPGQVPNIDAVLLHVLGAALAHLLCYPLVRAAFRRAGAAVGGRSRRATVPDPAPAPGGPLRTSRVRIAPRVDVTRSGTPYVGG